MVVFPRSLTPSPIDDQFSGVTMPIVRTNCPLLCSLQSLNIRFCYMRSHREKKTERFFCKLPRPLDLFVLAEPKRGSFSAMRIPQVKGHMAALAAFSEHMCGPEHVRCFGGSRLRLVVSVLSVLASLQCSILLKLQLHRRNDRTAWSYAESTEELQFRVVLCKVRHGKCVGPSWNMVRAFLQYWR